MKWFRRYRVAIGAVLMAVSVIGFAYLYTQSKININRVDEPCIITSVDKIGEETADKIIKNAPYEHIEDIKKLDGLAEVRGNAIKQRFSVYDTMRIDYYLIALAASAVMITTGSLIVVGTIYKRKTLSKSITEKLESLI